jgi:hypothetical protein
MTEAADAEKRHDELTRAPQSTEADAAPRIAVDQIDEDTTRIDIADTAAVRPGRPDRSGEQSQDA